MKKSGDKQTQTNTDKHTTPTRGRIIVADGIYSVGDKKKNSHLYFLSPYRNLAVADFAPWSMLYQCIYIHICHFSMNNIYFPSFQIGLALSVAISVQTWLHCIVSRILRTGIHIMYNLSIPNLITHNPVGSCAAFDSGAHPGGYLNCRTARDSQFVIWTATYSCTPFKKSCTISWKKN